MIYMLFLAHEYFIVVVGSFDEIKPGMSGFIFRVYIWLFGNLYFDCISSIVLSLSFPLVMALNCEARIAVWFSSNVV